MLSYSVVLTADLVGEAQTIRVHDNAHGVNEMHRFTRLDGKQPAERFSDASAGEAMRLARSEIRRSYAKMIEAWKAGSDP